MATEYRTANVIIPQLTSYIADWEAEHDEYIDRDGLFETLMDWGIFPRGMNFDVVESECHAAVAVYFGDPIPWMHLQILKNGGRIK